MKQVSQRRIVPIALITLVLFCLMGLFQVFVIAGGYEVEASTVKEKAPWAYESFIRLAGEHPDTRPEWAAGKKPEEKAPDKITIGGFSPESIPVTLEDQPVPEKKVIIQPTKPLEEPRTVIPVTKPVQEQERAEGEAVPVG